MQQKRERVPLIFFGTILRLFQRKENILLMSAILWTMEGMESSVRNNMKLLVVLFLFSVLSFWFVL